VAAAGDRVPVWWLEWCVTAVNSRLGRPRSDIVWIDPYGVARSRDPQLDEAEVLLAWVLEPVDLIPLDQGNVSRPHVQVRVPRMKYPAAREHEEEVLAVAVIMGCSRIAPVVGDSVCFEPVGSEERLVDEVDPISGVPRGREPGQVRETDDSRQSFALRPPDVASRTY